MGIKKLKAMTPGTRNVVLLNYEEITTTKPEKSLLVSIREKAGRNNKGKITCRHKGGRVRRQYRVIDFKRNKPGVPARVNSIEYDPNRTAFIALLFYKDGEKRYIIAPIGLNVGDEIMSGVDADIKVGNNLPLKNIPVGTVLNCLELNPGKGAQVGRSAGVGLQLLGKEGKYAMVRMPSGEIRKILNTCTATIGQVGNTDNRNIKLGKAGRKRWLGVKPTVRGVVMNPNDHPHGGGEGKSPIGYDAPRSPWGKRTLGVTTRKDKKLSNKFILKGRKKRR